MANVFKTVTIALILVSLIIGTVSAWQPGVPVTTIKLGDTIEEVNAINLDARSIVPANTFAICCLVKGTDPYTNAIFYRPICNINGGATDKTFGTVYQQALIGDYYAVPYPSPYIGSNNNSMNDALIVSDITVFRATNLRLFTVLPAPTPAATPVPTPTVGAITITSNPAGATIFLDNIIKGITPLTLSSVSNGDHNILLRLDNYKDSSKSVTVLGDTQTLNLVLELKTTQTTSAPTITATNGATTIPTTASVTTLPTTGSITTQFTTPATIATPITTATINYSATIDAMQNQIAEQNAKIEEQGSWIDQILRFLGLK